MKLEFDTTSLSPLDMKVLAVLATAEDWPKINLAEKIVTPAEARKPAPKAEPPAATGEAVNMADAVAAATRLVSTGKAADVKAALATVGAKRVSEIPAEKLGEFLAALPA